MILFLGKLQVRLRLEKNKIKFIARKSFQNLRVCSWILIDEMKNILAWFYHINFDNFLGDEAEKNILFTQRPIPEMFVRKFLELAIQKISVFLNRPFCTFYQNIFLYLIANQSKGRIDGTQFWFQPRMTNFGGIGVIVKTLYCVFKILVVIISLIISSHPYCIFIFWFRLW